MREYPLGRLGSLELSAQPSAFAGVVSLWAILAAVGIAGLRLGILEAVVGALAATLLHYAAELWHQLGHSWAARRTGYPMRGVRFWGWLSTAVYPAGEPPLPGATHVRRALGGPSASLLATVGAALLALAVRPPGVAGWVAQFFFADNLLVMTLGALLPLGFTDGSTLLRWWGKP